MGNGRSATGAAIGAALLVAALGGCAVFPTACPAIGWTNAVEVRVPGSSGATSAVREVAFCGGGDDCAPGVAPETSPSPTGNATPAAPPAPGPLTPKPEPTDTVTLSPTPWRTTIRDGEVWTISTDMGTPDRGRVALRDREGTTLTEQAVVLSWKRHGGSAQCGGPSTATVIVQP
ncbi:hypothetical protein ACO0E1_13035 [Curtobacterium sp. RRHDQ66]|uniref:hypothetical protein n=1 Tax=Curtobacterium guangdongense TaxID=3413380 RepID=UPI003BF0FB3F